MAANPTSKDIAISIDRVKLRAAAEAARGANLARKDGKHVPFSMNPDAVIGLITLAECWATAARQAERSRDDAWRVCDDAKAAQVAAEKRQVDLEAANTHLRGRNEDFINENARTKALLAKQAFDFSDKLHRHEVALEAAYNALEADRQNKSSDAMVLGDEAWPLVCAALGKPEHAPGRCALSAVGCQGYAHTAFVKGYRDAVAAREAATAAAAEALAAVPPPKE